MLRNASLTNLVLLAALALLAAILLPCLLGFFGRVIYLRATRDRVLRCPHCHGSDVRPSYPTRFPDGPFAWFGCLPYRCRACSCRFFRAKGLEVFSRGCAG